MIAQLNIIFWLANDQLQIANVSCQGNRIAFDLLQM